MPRFKASEVENYGGNGSASYFSLKNDKDTAKVRFMYNGLDDVEGCAVHEVEIGGKKRYINCLREYNDPMNVCPFCSAGEFQVVKFFIPLYDVDTKQVKIWERGRKFFSKISSICARYSNLVSHVFEIERNGAKGSTQTTYEIYEIDKDNTTLKDLPELHEIVGGLVLDKTADEMSYYLDNGVFPSDSNTSYKEDNEVPWNERNTRDNQQSESRPVGRRTPATSRRGERF